ncbi:MAG TPA: two-component regulator propeller domain-containing protein [Candidatus Hydrogenedentes bacterium]|nr:two-component regulator propeller domain-containing protein [Candidatus Hydrogenedentota bacterium]
MRNCVTGLLVALLCCTAVFAADEVPAKVGVFPQEIAKNYSVADGLPDQKVLSLHQDETGIVAVTAAGACRLEGATWKPVRDFTPQRFVLVPDGDAYTLAPAEAAPGSGAVIVRSFAGDAKAPVAIAAAEGLFLRNDQGVYEKSPACDGQGRLWGACDVRGVTLDSDGNLWVAMLAGLACRTADGWKFYTGHEGLPYNDFTSIAAGPDGAVWFGTTKGIVRFKNGTWHYRQGRRWLPDDHVNDLLVDQAGNAWAATQHGIGWIGFTPMTLAEKAAFYEEELDKYIKRTPFGYTSEVKLEKAGDRSTVVYTDSDNDGLWTSMYGAGECFAYGATRDPEAKKRADKAFEALRFLQTVPQTGDHRPPKGYVARTILPTDGKDPNEGRIERDTYHRDNHDVLWKVYEPRWPKSGDGKWYWKSDTSSDELDGHFFFYPAYYDLVAKTKEEKEAVQQVIRDLMDHLIDHDFNLVDFDGTPTRWSIYNPDSLNKDPLWWEERGLKSLSMLSYLTATEHVTGDPKYGKIANELIEKHHFRTNAMIYKIHFGPGSGNHSDDEMAFMCYYNLLKYSQDKALKHEILYSFFSAWINEWPEMNPLFNFMYAVFGRDAKHTNPWDTYDISPWEGWLDDSVETLKDFPLDRVAWDHHNSHRLDIVLLPRQQATEPYESEVPQRGHRVNGKVLPVSERYFNHWNHDPWNLNYGGKGHTLGSGTVFLLPYYMGLYHGFIDN